MGYLLAFANSLMTNTGDILKKKYVRDTVDVASSVDVYLLMIYPFAALYYLLLGQFDVQINLPTFLYAAVFALLSQSVTRTRMLAYRYTILVYIGGFYRSRGCDNPISL